MRKVTMLFIAATGFAALPVHAEPPAPAPTEEPAPPASPAPEPAEEPAS